MLFSLIFDALVASTTAFIITYGLLLAFGNLFLRKEKKLLRFNEIIREIRKIISEERK